MKEMVDTGYQRERANDARRREETRRANLSEEERDAEDKRKEEARIAKEASKAKLTDLNEEKNYGVEPTLQPHPRSFLI